MARLSPQPPHSILITGASSGIGVALARRDARPDTYLALGGRDSGRLATTVAACRQTGAHVTDRSIDVSDREAMAAWVGSVDRVAPLDLVIANASTAGRHLPDGRSARERSSPSTSTACSIPSSRPRRPCWAAVTAILL